MDALIEKIVDVLHHLPEDELQEVLDFAEVLAGHQNLEATNVEEQLNAKEMETEQPSTYQLEDAAFEATADQLADELAKYAGSNVPKLSDYAVSRASIYEDHS
jgi:TRAP-type C4-dicarboxylate transport system substrate-binding protein